MSHKKHLLFSYGTLQLPSVQLANYGRKLKGQKDVLPNYILRELEITDKEVLRKSQKSHHPIAIKTDNPDDCVEGTIFEINSDELHASDQYEVRDYIRVLETFSSGKQAWVYVAKQDDIK